MRQSGPPQATVSLLLSNLRCGLRLLHVHLRSRSLADQTSGRVPNDGDVRVFDRCEQPFVNLFLRLFQTIVQHGDDPWRARAVDVKQSVALQHCPSTLCAKCTECTVLCRNFLAHGNEHDNGEQPVKLVAC